MDFIRRILQPTLLRSIAPTPRQGTRSPRLERFHRIAVLGLLYAIGRTIRFACVSPSLTQAPAARLHAATLLPALAGRRQRRWRRLTWAASGWLRFCQRAVGDGEHALLGGTVHCTGAELIERGLARRVIDGVGRRHLGEAPLRPGCGRR